MPDRAEFRSEYEGTPTRLIAALPIAERKRRWEADRQAIADIWCNGDAVLAQAAFDALPYSTIPDWRDLDRVLRAFDKADVEIRRQS